MSPEPLLSPLRVPAGGWPRCAVRVELISPLTLDEAVFILAERSRIEHVAHVALYDGADLWAYPHQSVAEIADTHRRVRRLARAHIIRALKPGALRWTPETKLAVVLAAKELLVDRRDLLAVYQIGADELTAWEERYARFGLDGLKAQQVQTLRLSPPAPDALAAGFTSDFTSVVTQEQAHG